MTMPDTQFLEVSAPTTTPRSERPSRRRWLLALLLAINGIAFIHLAWRANQMREQPDGRASVTVKDCRAGRDHSVELVLKGALQPGEAVNAVSWHVLNSGRDAQFARQSFIVGPEMGTQLLTWTLPTEFASDQITSAVAAIRTGWLGREFELNQTNSPAVLILTNSAGARFIGMLAFSLARDDSSLPGGAMVTMLPSATIRADGEPPLAEVFVETREASLITLDFFIRRNGVLAHVPPLSGWSVAGTNGITDACFTWHAPAGSGPKPTWNLRVFDYRTKIDSLVVRAFATDLQGLQWRAEPKPTTVHPVGQGSYEIVLFRAQNPSASAGPIEAVVTIRRLAIPAEVRARWPLGGVFGGSTPHAESLYGTASQR